MNLSELSKNNPRWFSPENKRFFNDVGYWVKRSSTGQFFLVRSTYGWTDMFDRPKKLHYRINSIKGDLTIGSLIDQVFDSMVDVEEWLEEN